MAHLFALADALTYPAKWAPFSRYLAGLWLCLMPRAGAGTTSVPPPHEHRASTRSHGTLRQSGPVRGLAWAVLTHPIRMLHGEISSKLKGFNQKTEIEKLRWSFSQLSGDSGMQRRVWSRSWFVVLKLPTGVGHLHLLGVKVRASEKENFQRTNLPAFFFLFFSAFRSDGGALCSPRVNIEPCSVGWSGLDAELPRLPFDVIWQHATCWLDMDRGNFISRVRVRVRDYGWCLLERSSMILEPLEHLFRQYESDPFPALSVFQFFGEIKGKEVKAYWKKDWRHLFAKNIPTRKRMEILWTCIWDILSYVELIGGHHPDAWWRGIVCRPEKILRDDHHWRVNSFSWPLAFLLSSSPRLITPFISASAQQITQLSNSNEPTSHRGGQEQSRTVIPTKSIRHHGNRPLLQYSMSLQASEGWRLQQNLSFQTRLPDTDTRQRVA